MIKINAGADGNIRAGYMWVSVGLVALFFLALLPRYASVQSLGWNWDAPGSFTLVNFDEGGSCRAALDGFPYSTFIGRHTIAIATLQGAGPPPAITGDARLAKAYCQSTEHIRIARLLSAVAGAFTAVLITVLGLMLVPGQPLVAFTAGVLLAISGFHISESHSGTVDAPLVFYVYLFLTLLVAAVTRRSVLLLLVSLCALVAAVWTKYWFFAIFALLGLLPASIWRYVTHGMSAGRITLIVLASAVLMGLLSTSEFRQANLYPLLAAWYLVIPWRRVHRPMLLVWLSLPVCAYAVCFNDFIFNYTTSGSQGIFGTAYGAIGWHKWLRNPLNVSLVFMVGLGIPACLLLPAGVRYILRGSAQTRAWVCLLLPMLVFVLYMAFVAPVTYYRHYLVLLPAAALLSACGVYALAWHRRRWFMVVFFLWPALLAVDFVIDYHRDPRIALREWFKAHSGARVFASYYVNPPPVYTQLLKPEYAFGDARILQEADYLVLSENWYDTAFANELNGPRTSVPERLIKTTPEYAEFYRTALADEHPHLVEEYRLPVSNFMPELVLHKIFYGTFQVFVGDLRIFRIVASRNPGATTSGASTNANGESE